MVTRSVAVGVLALAWATAACTGRDAAPTSTSSPSATVALPPLRTVYSGELVGLQTIPWHGARVESDTELDVLFDGSPVACRQLANVRVAEGTDRVTITVFEGQVPSRANEVCPAIAESARVRVSLTTPLGTRRVLDGSASPPVDRPITR